MRVVDTTRPGQKAFEVGEEWWNEMNDKYPKRFQKVEAPQVIVVPKKKIDVPAVVVEKNIVLESQKKEVTLKPDSKSKQRRT